MCTLKPGVLLKEPELRQIRKTTKKNHYLNVAKKCVDKYSPDPHLMQQNNTSRKGLNNLVALLITMKTR